MLCFIYTSTEKKERLCYGEHKSIYKIMMSVIDLRKTHTYLGYSPQ